MELCTQPIVILSGAGISAESGIRTFRAADGLWEEHRVEDVASPEGFERDPALVQRFYNQRRAQLQTPEIRPNAAHRALARLESRWEGPFLLVTQNVDDLHDRAGSKRLLHMHGELMKARCQRSGKVLEWKSELSTDLPCPCCRSPGSLRPHIVWFGEMPLHMDEITDALSRAKVFLSIGTSGQVYPAAGFVSMVPRDCRKIEINAESTAISDAFDEHLVGPASARVPEIVEHLLFEPA